MPTFKVSADLDLHYLVDDFTDYLHRRWHDGERNATQLFREIKQRGYPGGELAVQRYLRRFRHGRGHAPRPGPKPPSVRQVTSWIMTHPDDLDPRDAAKLRAIRDRNTDLDTAYGHPTKKGIPAAVVLSPQNEVLYATRLGELADARNMSETGIYDFFRKVTDDARRKR